MSQIDNYSNTRSCNVFLFNLTADSGLGQHTCTRGMDPPQFKTLHADMRFF